MTKDMVEKVARAISGAPFPSKASLAKARAAIAAMREPTEEMVDAAAPATDGERVVHRVAYRLMVNAALTPSDNPSP